MSEFNIVLADWMPKDTIWFVPTVPDEIRLRGTEAITEWLKENSNLVVYIIPPYENPTQQEVG